MKNLKIAFLGGTYANTEIAIQCDKLGAKSYLLDKNKNCFAKLNKNFINIDFNNKSKFINFIKKNKINYLYTTQSDIGILTLGFINSKFNLPGTSYKVASILTDKYKIRGMLKRKKFNQPEFYLINKNLKKKIMENNQNFLIKPLDSSGSRGIFEISVKQNLKKIINKSLKFSRKNKVIIEQKIDGTEFGAQTFSIKGDCKKVILHEDIMSKINSKIPVGHVFPFLLIKNKIEINKIKKIIKMAVNTFGVKNGPCNVDCMYTKDKKLFILEISPRLGATCLPGMLKIYTDVDWDLKTIKLHNYGKIPKFTEKKNTHVASKIFESSKSGVIKSIKTMKIPNNAKVEFLVKKNDKINKFTDGTKYYGYIVAHSNNRKKLLNIISKFEKSIKIKFF